MDSHSPKPLRGLRVLDLGHTIMGPCAGLVFADLGAEVTKVEPVGGDPTRRLGGFATGFFGTFNRNKRGIAIDLKRPEARAIMERLIARADVFIENFGPGTIERLGYGWEYAHSINPRLVYLALKGFLSGPYENRGALDEVVQMQSGLAYMTGPPGRPLRVGASVIDMFGAIFGVVATLAALRERERTGLGMRVRSSLFESAVFMMGPHMAGSAIRGEPIPPMPARSSAWGVYDVFTTRDSEQLFLGITSDAQWERFCSEFGFDPGSYRDALQTNQGRAQNRDWLIPRIETLFAERDASGVLASCERASLPHARVGQPHELAADEHLQTNGALVRTMLEGIDGKIVQSLVPALPIEFGADAARFGIEMQPPRLGQHSVEVLAELGFSTEAVHAFVNDGVVRSHVDGG